MRRHNQRRYLWAGLGILLACVPLIALAQNGFQLVDVLSAAGVGDESLSGVSGGLFSPPLTDKSVFLLQHLFGSVGMLLEGTGTQLLGEMFAIFNLGIWVVAGGLADTVGVVFYADERPYAHFVWHLFVLAGTACHLVAVLSYAA